MGDIEILLIDDEEDYSDTMGFYLKAKGYRVRACPSGADGILEIRRERPDIVFLDFMMPGMDGAETLGKIREMDASLPVIMVTSYAVEDRMEAARRSGISAIFPKGADFSEAAKMISEALKCLKREP
ncbi:MAG: response regulator [Deltaproteobacteria bacterium]|nr:response regulator [Deltaproteobacteria bacterium]